MKRYSKKQLNAISRAKIAKQRALEEAYLENVGYYDEYNAQSKYKTMRGYINYITYGHYSDVIK